MKLIVIAALTQQGVIGMNNELPWRLKEDLRRFKQHTKGHAVIMGRKTRESLPDLLPDRFNIVVTSKFDPSLGDAVVTSLAQAIVTADQENYEKIFVIGGAQLYQAAIPVCDEALVTRVDAPELLGDTHLEPGLFEQHLGLLSQEKFAKNLENEYDMTFERWVR